MAGLNRRGSRFRTMSLMWRLSNVRRRDAQARFSFAICPEIWPAKCRNKLGTSPSAGFRYLTWRPQPALLPQKFRNRFAAFLIILSAMPRRRAARSFIRAKLATAQCGDRTWWRLPLRCGKHLGRRTIPLTRRFIRHRHRSLQSRSCLITRPDIHREKEHVRTNRKNRIVH